MLTVIFCSKEPFQEEKKKKKIIVQQLNGAKKKKKKETETRTVPVIKNSFLRNN